MFTRTSRPHVVPFAAFLGFLVLAQVADAIFKGHGPPLLAEPRYWIYPLQTLTCGALVAVYWRSYEFGPFRRPIFTLGVAVFVLILWVSPQEFFEFPPRTQGFDPTVFEGDPALYWGNLGFRFLRLVVVVPLVEEIFWRGFLLRFLINEDFRSVGVGTFSWGSFLWVSLLFGLEHAGPDIIPAVITGACFNGVAYRTRSLTACVIVHAAVNLGLGLYIMRTGQWGFW